MDRTFSRAVLALTVMTLQALAPACRAAEPDAVTVDGGRYYGPLVQGKLHGRGRIEWDNGSRYEGEFREGVMSGQGELRFRNGRTYRGGFARGEFDGQGRFEHPNGDVYEGQFTKGYFTGDGRYARKDGARYEGAFRNWQFHGPGRYTDQTGNTYEGSFASGQLDGPGKVTGNGASYEGELKQWRFHGRGVLRLANGDVYEGNFEHGLYEGQGTLKYAKPRPDGRTEESGAWRYGVLTNDDERRKAQSDVESALYLQKTLLDKALASLKRRQAGKINMYLLAVAGDGSQEVFRREVHFVQDAFAGRFGTAGRSVALVNSRTTMTSAPMATVTSIRVALKAISARMDRNQDILFLFLTSHGSQEHELSLNQAGMTLRGLRAAELGELLKESGIRWKVVVVSACYSGGFVDALQDGNTLVITASRRDRRSFGCADENDFTYFGRAFFKEALPGAGSFQQAFSKASALVQEWERNDVSNAAATAPKPAKPAEETHSVPQIYSPPAIETHLQRWWSQAHGGARRP